MPETIAGLPIRNTNTILTKHTKICSLVYAAPKKGKTTFGATLDQMTKKYFGKPTLVIACEAADGGGTFSIQKYGVDFVEPDNLNELRQIIAALKSDSKYGGIVLDHATEVVNRFYKPQALNLPSRDKTAGRQFGVPEQSDYQTMGELMRTDMNQLINLTTLTDPNLRKHLVVFAHEKEKYSRDGKELLEIRPDLPGAMASAASAMFQTVASIKIRQKVEGGKRITERLMFHESDGVRICGDRTGCFPNECPTDFVWIWENGWMPQLKERGIE